MHDLHPFIYMYDRTQVYPIVPIITRAFRNDRILLSYCPMIGICFQQIVDSLFAYHYLYLNARFQYKAALKWYLLILPLMAELRTMLLSTQSGNKVNY